MYTCWTSIFFDIKLNRKLNNFKLLRQELELLFINSSLDLTFTEIFYYVHRDSNFINNRLWYHLNRVLIDLYISYQNLIIFRLNAWYQFHLIWVTKMLRFSWLIHSASFLLPYKCCIVNHIDKINILISTSNAFSLHVELYRIYELSYVISLNILFNELRFHWERIVFHNILFIILSFIST